MTSQQLQQIINSLNHATGAGWQALIQQQYITAWTELVWAFILVVVVAVLVRVGFILRSKAIEVSTDDDDRVYWWSGAGVAWVISFLVLLICFGLISSAVAHFLDPGCGAINSLPSFVCPT